MNTKEKILRIKNHYNFYGNYTNNLPNDTNYIASLVIRNFIAKYQKNIENKCTFIIQYNNDIYSLILARLLRAAEYVTHKNLNLKILGKFTEDEKEYFKGIDIIKSYNIKKMRTPILISPYNPIVNVNCLLNLSNEFSDFYCPLERIEPRNLAQLMDFYVEETDKLYSKKLKEWIDIDYNKKIENLEIEFFPYSESDIHHYILSGTEKDFGLYGKILLDSKKGIICLYSLPNDKIDFFKTNIIQYIDYCNLPNDFNIVTDEEWEEWKKEINNYEEYNYIDYNILSEKEEENENSNT